MKRAEGIKNYKQRGKILIPPLLQAIGDTLVETSYINDVLPNIVWAGMLMEKHGAKRGLSLSARFIEKIYEITSLDVFYNFAMLSSFEIIPDDKKVELRNLLKNQEDFSPVSEILRTLNTFYPRSPVKFLGSSRKLKTSENLENLRNAVGYMTDKFGRFGVLAQSPILYARHRWGTAGYGPHLSPPDLNSVFAREESEEFLRISANIRICSLTEFLPERAQLLKKWPAIFWADSYKLDGCI